MFIQFVQSLANMQYLTYLAQTGHLEDPKFLNYLKYLEYWRQPEYAKQLVYPDCLHILTLLQSEEFRKQVSKFEVSSVIYNDMVARWKEPLGVEGNAGKKEDGSDRKAEGEKVTLNEDDKEEEDKKAKRKAQKR